MTEKMNQLMKDVPAIRWTALILLASAMFFGYIFMDILSPLQELLQTSRGWSPDAYGHYAGSETFLNVFVFFLIFAGIILDKMGVRFTAILSGAVMLAGASINYFAVSNAFIGSGAESLMNRFMNLPLEWWNITPFYEGMPGIGENVGYRFHVLRLWRRNGRNYSFPRNRQMVQRERNGTRHGGRNGYCPCGSRRSRLRLPGLGQ